MAYWKVLYSIQVLSGCEECHGLESMASLGKRVTVKLEQRGAKWRLTEAADRSQGGLLNTSLGRGLQLWKLY